MKNKQIQNMRMDLGKFLHNYYVQFGEMKYEKFVEKIGNSMEREFGEPFSSENLRIMEAEYVTFNTRIDEKSKFKGTKITS